LAFFTRFGFFQTWFGLLSEEMFGSSAVQSCADDKIPWCWWQTRCGRV